MIDPETALIVAAVGAGGSLLGAVALELGQKIGPLIHATDLLPLLPWEGLPLPRFTKKPEVMKALRELLKVG